MKKIIIGLFTILFAATTGYSQIDNEDIDIVQAVFGINKRLIIEENIQLNENEKKSFWLIYDQYEKKRKKIEKDGFLLLKEYVDKYQTLDDAQADKLIVNFLKSTEAYNTLHKIYFKKMKKDIGSLKAAKFIQLEIFIQTTLQANLQSQVPVIEELERLNQQNAGRKFDN